MQMTCSHGARGASEVDGDAAALPVAEADRLGPVAAALISGGRTQSARRGAAGGGLGERPDGSAPRAGPLFRSDPVTYIPSRVARGDHRARLAAAARGGEKRMNFVRTMMLLAALTALFMGVGYLIGGTGGMMIALLFAIGTNAFAWWNSDKVALRMHDAEPVTRASAPELYDMVGAAGGQCRPADAARSILVRSDQPNAFATGRNPENAAVAATTGILRVLDREELEGVIAHELAHIKNRDTLTMTIAATVAGAISMLAQFGFLFGGGGRDRDNPLGLARGAAGGDLRAAGGDADPDDDQPDPGIFRRPRRRRDQRQPAGRSRARSRKISAYAARDRHAERRAQPDLGAALHRQPAERAADGQSLLDASGRREPHRARSRRWPATMPAGPGGGARARLDPRAGAAARRVRW